MCDAGQMDEATWGALALALTLLGGGYTWWAFRNRGAAAGLRGLAITLLFPAAWLTGTLRMFTRIADAVVDWATRLVFSPTVWVGVVLAGLAVVLFVVSGILRGRQLAAGAPAGTPAETRGRPQRTALPPTTGQAPPPAAGQQQPADDDLADIEAILRRRGIT